MATNIIYKGEKVGTQVDFQTGSLTDISTFTGDVRLAAIQDQIVGGVADIGASQDAIHAMSGYLAANAHPTVIPAEDTGLALSNGNVIQDISFAFDDDGHVTAASFNAVDLDGRYFTVSEVTGISGALQSQITGNDADISINATDIATLSGLITGNDGDISTNATDIVTLSGLITGNDGDISTNATDIVTLSGLITGNDGDISINATDIVTLSGLITGNDGDISTNATDIVTLSGLITGNDGDISTNATDIVTLSGLITGNDGDISINATDIATLSGLITGLTLDDVASNDGDTSAEVEVGSLRVAGDGASASITGPATITIDPDAEGADGLVVIAGDLQVDGTTTTINSTSVQIDDLNLLLGTGAPNNESADGAGIIVDGTGELTIAEFTYDGTNDRWTTNGTDIKADIIGTATGAGAWTTARTITLNGDVTGVVTIDGGSNQTLTTTIDDNSISSNEIQAGAVISGKIGSNEIHASHLNDDIAGDNVTIADGVLSVADSDIRAGITGSASTIVGDHLTANRALAIDGNSKVAVATTTLAELNHLTGVSSSVKDQLDAKALESITITGSNGLTGGGNLSTDRTLTTVSDQSHLDEIELGSDDNSITNVVTKGGILILRGKNTDGITSSGIAGNAIDLNDKTTVAFEGVAQSANIGSDGDSDGGSYVAMWKIQGAIRRDADSTNMLQSFITKTFEGADATGYELNVSVDNAGLKISSDQDDDELITSATINYNWIEDTTA